jgi:NADH dehydrogenase/NADH:ubiquinone oxidoreductase subunit G
MADKVKITFNGKEIWDTPGKPILQAAIDSGIEVPHFCYHPGIGIEGSCRLCLVQIEGMPKLQTSCTIPLKEGMVVSSVSEPVKKARKGVLEFFLLNHPLDCPICDKGGECPLQNYSLDSGQSESRFDYKKINKAKHQSIGEHIVLDKERCVLCDRCVRFLRNFTGREEMQIKNRGAKSEIFVAGGEGLTSGYTGNLADICPVGSLTTKEFRFRARPWEMKTVDTVCGGCSIGCNAQAWKTSNKVLRLTPRVEESVNEWWLCDMGRFSLHGHLTEDRLTTAHKPGNGTSLPAREALGANVAAIIKQVPKGDMAYVADASLTNEEFFQLKSLAKLAGGGKVFAPVSNEVLKIRRLIQARGVEGAFPTNLESAKRVFVVGERLESDHPVLVLRLRRLFHTGRLQVFTMGSPDLGFEDIRKHHIQVEESGWARAIHALLSEEVFAGGEPVHVLLSDRIVNAKTVSALEWWLNQLESSGKVTVSLLLTGANAAGMCDQWVGENSPVMSRNDLETEIQRGKVQGLLWFGSAPVSDIFSEYARGMRIFVQFVSRLKDLHPKAHLALPMDSYLEKKGTYTNTFGKIQPLRRAKRVIEKGYEPSAMLSLLSENLGQPTLLSVEKLYEELAQAVGHYPKKMVEIPESRQTYTHYERALWR